MTNDEVRSKIQELDKLRKETRNWRLGTTLAVVIITVAGTGTLLNSVHELFRPGPTQNQFTAALTADMRKDVLPPVEDLARQSLTESKPQIQDAFTKLNTRVPELTSASLAEFSKLQQDLPQQGDKTLDATYGQMLKSREAKLTAMFPDVQESNVSTLVDTMTAEGEQQIADANDKLFAKHIAAMNGIESDITKIQNSEAVTPDQDQANWEMALLVVNNFQSDLQGMQATNASASATKADGKAAHS